MKRSLTFNYLLFEKSDEVDYLFADNSFEEMKTLMDLKLARMFPYKRPNERMHKT